MLEQTFRILGPLLIASAVGAQSLGDVAKREKKRRASIEKSEPANVITESDLGDGSSEEPVEDSRESEASSKRVGGRPSIPPTMLPIPDADLDAGASADPPPADTWDETFAEYQRAYDEGKAIVRFAQSFQKHCEEGTPPPPLPPVRGGYWMVDCDSFPKAITETQRRMKQLQQECSNHARRLGVLPGRARLR